MTIPDSSSLHTGNTFSLEAWVKPARLGSVMVIFAKSQYMLLLTKADKLQLYKNNSGAIATSTSPIADASAWHYVVATKTGLTAHLYIDGQDVTGPVSNRTILNSTAPLTIGSGAAYFYGAIDEAAVYPRALSVGQVNAHYAAAHPAATTATK